MNKFHIGENGPAKCTAEKVKCPIGGVHTDTIEEASKLFEKQQGSSFTKPTLPKKEVLSLINELHSAAASYYQDLEESDLTDEEFDEKLEYLETLRDEHPELFGDGSKGHLLLEGDPSLGTKTTAKETIIHNIPMLSQAKAKTTEELTAHINKLKKEGAESFTLQAKLDGFALSALYSDGELHTVATRGDGQVGENITYIIHSNEIEIKGLPLTISDEEPIEIRGEVFLTDKQFEALVKARKKATGEDFKNSRNAVVGTISKARKGLGYNAEMTFSAYSTIKNGKLQDIGSIEKLGVYTVNQLTKQQAKGIKLSGNKTLAQVLAATEAFGKARENFSIPTDGVVIKPSNEAEMQEKMGDTSHHPSSQIAFKYPGEKAITEILDISTTVGKTGRITPVGRVKPVELSGVTISNVSLHNFNWMHERNVRVGSIVSITRANDVIPYVSTVISNPKTSSAFTTPAKCPECGNKLVGDTTTYNPPRTLECRNLDCASRKLYALKAGVGKNYLDIDGMNISLAEGLYKSGRVKDVSDLYTLTEKELSETVLGTTTTGNVRTLGDIRAKKIIEQIEKSKNAPLYKIMASMNIEDMGRSMSKLLVKKYGTIERIQKATFEEISNLDGFGEIRARNIVEGLKHNEQMITKLKKAGVKLEESASAAAPSKTAINLSGQSFAISGAVPSPFSNRNAMVDYIESNGGEFHSAPKAGTTYMIGDKSEGSSKIKKALSLGVEFISPTEFTNKFTK